MDPKHILIVDDERTIADTLVLIMKQAGYRCAAAYSAQEALMSVRRQMPDLMISDVIMPGGDGVELAIAVHRQWPEMQVLLVSGNATTQTIIDSARAHGHKFELLAKPVPPEQLLIRVASMLERPAAEPDAAAKTPCNCAYRTQAAS